MEDVSEREHREPGWLLMEQELLCDCSEHRAAEHSCFRR